MSILSTQWNTKSILHWALSGNTYVIMYPSTTKKMELLSTKCSSKTFIKLSTQWLLTVQGYWVLNVVVKHLSNWVLNQY